MALAATNHWEVRNGGNDTTCSGGFDPGQTAGMNTDGAATVATGAAPVFTSASYNFVAGDVGAWLYIAAGTNWIVGWFQIASVALNAATLTATAGSYYSPLFGNTGTGCATVASPTSATWSIDYSQQNANRFAYTDLTSTGVGMTVTSAAHPFGKQQVGNSLNVGAVLSWGAGIYTLASVSGVTGTFIGAGNLHTGAGTDGDGTGYMGGAHASPGLPAGFMVAGNTIWVGYNASPYLIGSATQNIATGRIVPVGGSGSSITRILGYTTLRGDNAPTKVTLKWNVNAGNAYILDATGVTLCRIEGFIFDGNRANKTGTGGFGSSQLGFNRNIKVMGCSWASFQAANSSRFESMEVTDCSATSGSTNSSQTSLLNCYFHDNLTAAPITLAGGRWNLMNCVFDTNLNAAAITVSSTTWLGVKNCTFYGSGGAGIDFTAQPQMAEIVNCIFEANGDRGIKLGGSYPTVRLTNCAFFNNTTAKYSPQTILAENITGEIIPTASPFENAAAGNFQLNRAAGTLLTGTGFPANFPGLTWTNYPDVGAATPQNSGGSGTPFGAGFLGFV